MSTFIEYDHPDTGLHTLEVKEAKEVAVDKVDSLIRCMDPNDAQKTFTAYFCVDDIQHAKQHEYFLAELGLSDEDLKRSTPGLYEEVAIDGIENAVLARQLQAHDDGRIYGIYYLGGELKELEMQRQEQNFKEKASVLGSLSLRQQ